MLMLLTSDFELMLSEVMRKVLEDQPGLIASSEASLSLADLEELGDLGAACDLIITRRVYDLMRKSLQDWSAWFDRIGVKFEKMTDDWIALAEVFARRNAAVHAGSKVSQQYRRALAPIIR